MKTFPQSCYCTRLSKNFKKYVNFENMAVKTNWHGNVNVDVHITKALKCPRIHFRISRPKSGGHSLNGLEAVQL